MTNHPNRSAANQARRISRRIAAGGYSLTHARAGLAYANQVGFQSDDEGFVLAMSRILYTDAQLAEGERFSVS